MTILAAARYRSNAELIEACVELGYLADDGLVLDVTYGRGTFWRNWQPKVLIGHDRKLDGVDFRHLPYGDGAAPYVVFDPPYKLNGTPSEPDERYGVDEPSSIAERHKLMLDGLDECARVLANRGYLLAKCMDQVASGRKWWQTRMLATRAEEHLGLRHVDSLLMLTTPRAQPAGRRQLHAAQNFSTLLVFRKDRVRGRR